MTEQDGIALGSKMTRGNAHVSDGKSTEADANIWALRVFKTGALNHSATLP
jgi:hypothetical protein